MTSPSLTTYSLPSRRILPGLLRAVLALAAEVVGVGDRLGADEALLEIGVDDAGRLRRRGADSDRPRAHFLRPRGEVGLQPEQLVAGVDHAVEAGLGEAQVVEERLLVVAVEVGDLGLERRAHRHHRRAFLRRVGVDRVEQRVVVEAVFRDVRHVHRRLHRQEEERLQQRALLGVEVRRARGTSLVEHLLDLLQDVEQALRFLVAPGAGQLVDLQYLLLDRGEVGQRELGVDRLDVRDRVHLAR